MKETAGSAALLSFSTVPGMEIYDGESLRCVQEHYVGDTWMKRSLPWLPSLTKRKVYSLVGPEFLNQD